MQDESDASSNRVASILRMYLAGSFGLLVGHSRSKARFDYWDSRRDLRLPIVWPECTRELIKPYLTCQPPFAPAQGKIPHRFQQGIYAATKAAEAPKFERLPLCLWYCCMYYILPA